MKTGWVSCPLCGHEFDPVDQAACPTCPLHKNCAMICCPACGHTTIDPQRSRLARWVSRLLPEERKNEQFADQ